MSIFQTVGKENVGLKFKSAIRLNAGQEKLCQVDLWQVERNERKLETNFHKIFRIVLQCICTYILINLTYIDVFFQLSKNIWTWKADLLLKIKVLNYFPLSFCYRTFIIFWISYKLYINSSIYYVYLYLIFVLLLFMILFLWPHCSCPNDLVTSNMAPAHPRLR